jgi:FTR1 family protein
MFEALVVTLREGIEAALVVGIILIYLDKTGRREFARWVYAGLAAGVAASIVCAAIIAGLGIEEEAYEGWLMIAGAVCVAGMVYWMLKTSKYLKGEIESKLERLSSGSPRAVAWGLFGLTFVLVLREGVETVLFLAAVNLTTDAILAFLGGLIGIALAIAFGVAFVRGTVRIDLPRFFKVTANILFVLAAQLLIGGIHELGERGTIPLGRFEMRVIGPIVKNDVIVLISLLAVPLIFLLVPGRADRARTAQAQALEGPERRLALAKLQRERFWQRGFAIAGIVVIASLTLSVAFTRLPHSIDPPKLLELGSGGEIHVPKAGLDDGHLHRFGVPVGTTVVRFFVMKSGNRVVPAFDACEVCGAYGYIESKGRLVCLACAADINTATIGIGGGCNPLPLKYRDTGSELVIALQDLADKAAAFKDAASSAPAPPSAN